MRKKTRCLGCGRMVSTAANGTYNLHAVSDRGGEVCRMTFQRRPIQGDTARDYFDRANLVANLAWQLQDEDPHIVYEYLTSLDPTELARLALIAMAGLPVGDQDVHEIWAWVHQLPVARQRQAVAA